jgi:phosphoglycolate phosphatase
MNRALVIFDLDGTLYQTEHVLIEAVKLASRELGIPISDNATIRSAIGLPTAEFVSHICGELKSRKRDELARLIRYHERRLIPEIGRPYDGVAGLLRRITDHGLTVAVCSSGSEEYIELVLTSCRLRNYVTHIEGHRQGADKGDQVSLLLGQVKPSWAVMIGDRKYDLEAAAKNALPFIGAGYGYGPGDLTNTNFVAESPQTLQGMILRHVAFERIASDLKTKTNNTATIIGIDGIDCAGKTTFANALTLFLGGSQHRVRCIHIDDFLNEAEVRNKGSDPVRAYIENAFNLHLLIDQILEPVRRGIPVDKTLTLLDLDTNRFDRRVRFRIDSQTIVLIDGVLLYRDPLDRYFDYRIFLDIAFEEMLKRATARDIPRFGKRFIDRYRSKYIPVQEWYLASCQPRQQSDLVVDNTNYNDPVIQTSD